MHQSVGHGGKRDGAGRPKGALNRLTRPVKELAAEHGADSIAKLIHLRDYALSEQVQFAAAKELLDRGFGRPRQEYDPTEDGKITVIVQRHNTSRQIEEKPILIESSGGVSENK